MHNLSHYAQDSGGHVGNLEKHYAYIIMGVWGLGLQENLGLKSYEIDKFCQGLNYITLN